jgi:RNA polymerase sigma factor (sigma-70 family)
MTKQIFDKWCNDGIDDLRKELVAKYPKSKQYIDEDISEFYQHMIPILHKIQNPRAYLFQWVYNRHYLYHTYIPKIKFVDELPDLIDEVYQENQIIDDVIKIIEALPLDYQVLYHLYFVKKLSGRAIGRHLGISHSGVHTQIKELKNKIKEKICLSTYFLD